MIESVTRIDKLQQTAELLDRSVFQAGVNALKSAKNIYILGSRSTAPLASFFGYYLSFMFNNVHIVTASGTSEVFEKVIGIGEGDAAFAISFPRYSAATVKGAQYCRSTGATVIGLTDNRMSPLGQHCDHILLAKSDMVSLVDSLIAPLSVINALIVALTAGRENVLSSTFETLERIWEEYNVYEKRIDNK